MEKFIKNGPIIDQPHRLKESLLRTKNLLDRTVIMLICEGFTTEELIKIVDIRRPSHIKTYWDQRKPLHTSAN
jgi:hypothetical protein